MAPLTTSYDTGVNAKAVKITWVAPYANSETIIDYEIQIRTVVATVFSLETVTCNGAVAPIKTQLYCFIPLTTLRIGPFSLIRKALVVAKARARNQFGIGEYSELNVSGALVQTEPDNMTIITLDILVSSNT